jgi:hypothetical protein
MTTIALKEHIPGLLKLGIGWEIYISKRQRKNLQLEVFLSNVPSKVRSEICRPKFSQAEGSTKAF